MILVADSGSTKTTWASVETGNKVVTEGLNPHFSTDKQVLDTCNAIRHQLSIPNYQFSIHFYGAGCGDQKQAERMRQLLQQGFDSMNVTVNTDLLGACRSVSKGQPCLVGILGTGSNACYFDGNEIIAKVPSLGYMLGDEGSANHMGRILLCNYLNGHMSEALRHLFHVTYPYDEATWIAQLYQKPNANRFLASLAPFAIAHADEPECQEYLHTILNAWRSVQLEQLMSYTSNRKLHVVGGFAKAIEQQLREFMTSSGLEVGTVIADPIEGLISYHLSL